MAAFRTELGRPWILPVVKEVEKMIADTTADHEELPPFGLSSFRKAVMELVLGKRCSRIEAGQVLVVQTVSGSGAMRFICELAWKNLKYREIYLPSPTRENTHTVFKASGFSHPKTYRYYDLNTHELDLSGMLEDLHNIPRDSVVLFQVCCHDPTGCDPNKKQWKAIAKAIGGRLFPVFDLSHQGMATGNPDLDAYPVRLFANSGINLAISVSFAENFLLYHEWVGAAIFILQSKEHLIPLKSHLATMIRAQYGSPPYYGAKIVEKILSNQSLFDQWIECLNNMTCRIKYVRKSLVEALKCYKAPGDWDYIKNGVGTTLLTNLTDHQIQHLILYHHVYVRTNGQIYISGLNENSINYVAEAIANSIREYPEIDISY